MKVKVIDESHEKDLERSINTFLSEGNYDIIDIKYQVAIAVCGEEQIYCFSAMIIYNKSIYILLEFVSKSSVEMVDDSILLILLSSLVICLSILARRSSISCILKLVGII